MILLALFSLYALQTVTALVIFSLYVLSMHRRLRLLLCTAGFLLLTVTLCIRFLFPSIDQIFPVLGTAGAYLLLIFGIIGQGGFLESLGGEHLVSRQSQIPDRFRTKSGSSSNPGMYAAVSLAGFPLLSLVHLPSVFLSLILSVMLYSQGMRMKERFRRWFALGFVGCALGEISSALIEPFSLPSYVSALMYLLGFTILLFSLWRKALLSFNLRYFLTSLLTGSIGVIIMSLVSIIIMVTAQDEWILTSSFLPVGLGSLAIIVTLYFPSWRAAKAFSEPIRDIIEQTSILQEGKLEPFRANLSSVEYNQLIDGLNIMVRAIDKNREDLESQIIRLKELDRLREEFLANVSHELRTPLTMIIGNSELILAGLIGEISEEQREFLQPVYDEAHKLLQLITDVLNFSRIERGVSELHIEEIQMADLIDSVLTQFLPLAKHRQIKIFKEAQPIKMGGDPDKIRQIIVHLIGNALKFNAKGGKVRVRVKEMKNLDEERQIEIQVSDTGIGIRPEILPTIFDKFRQGDGSATREFGGTGIGLTIVKSFTELHNGTVDVKSIVGKGSQFTVLIPDKPVAKTESLDQVSEKPATQKENTLVMIIESDPNIAKLLKTYLVHGGYNAVAVSSGTEAIEQTSRLKPQVLCINPALTDMNGWELIKRLKKNETTMEIPIVVTSVTDNRTLAKKLGVHEYLVMPIQRSTFLDTINKLLAR